MKGRRAYRILLAMTLLSILLQGCIHEYPHPVKGNSSDKGEDPTAINTFIEVSYDLVWENILHNVSINTKSGARDERPHRFVIEVLKESEVVCHDIAYLSPDEFSLGILRHKLSVPLKASVYQIAVWYDLKDSEGNHAFDIEELREVSMLNLSTTDGEAFQCAYASDYLDLREYSDASEEIEIKKELELDHPGARFEIVTTDIQKFIATYKASLNQGDSFTAHLHFTDSTPVRFNLHTEDFDYGHLLNLSGRMRLPFADYDELKIAEGFVFCKIESEVTLQLEVKNSSLLPVCKSEYFTFPVKRGHITTARGEFLSSPVDGLFSINTIWDGEIVIEI